MLCLHLPALLPASFSEVSTSSVVQTAALLGVGLLYQGTAHRLTVEFLLAEVGRGAAERDEGDNASRGSAGSSGGEGYSLAAGLGLGLLTLGRGRQGRAAGLADLRIEERLQRYMTGGKERSGWVNTTITAAGATLALGMMFLRSNNHAVAARLAVPDTLFLLDFVRPDLLMLRTLCRGLVLWDAVVGTAEWVEAQIPCAISDAFDRLGSLGEAAAAAGMGGDVDWNSVRQARANIVAGACAAIG